MSYQIIETKFIPSKQENGDFLKVERWQFWKVLRGRADPEKSISGTQQWNTTKNALTD